MAPADLQARIVRIGDKYTVSCMPGEKVSGHRPSVDALFQSMSEVVRCKMVGIIMTGMGQDGAAGLLAMRRKGAYTIGQDKESSVVYGMPMVANDIGGGLHSGILRQRGQRAAPAFEDAALKSLTSCAAPRLREGGGGRFFAGTRALASPFPRESRKFSLPFLTFLAFSRYE